MTTHIFRIGRTALLASSRLAKTLALLSAAAVGIVGSINGHAAPATWVVDALHDSSPPAGSHTLRSAVAAANAGDFIEFSPTLFSSAGSQTLTLTQGAVSISKSLTIVGPGDNAATREPMLQITGNGASRIFQIVAPANVTISGVGIRNGIAPGGGGVLVASGAALTLLESDITGCTASGSATGGGILNQGTLALDRVLVASNRASDGGGIASTGRLQVTRSLIQSNTASNLGGGIYSGSARFVVESSTIAANQAGTGGGIVSLASGKTTVESTLSGVTVVGNSARAQAGGLYVEGASAVVSVGGSIFTGNVLLNTNGSTTPRDLGVQKSGKINTADYNIVSKPGTTLSPYGAHDQVNVDPQLGLLSYNGGRTRSYLPTATSPAIDRGDPAFVGGLVSTDQRGLPRVAPQPNGVADVGAVEVSAPTLSLPSQFVFECAGALTTGTLRAELTLPGGGTATVAWTINGVQQPAASITVPSDGLPLELTQTGQFSFGSNTAAVQVVAGSITVTRSTVVLVKDTTPPAITVAGAAPVTTEWGSPYADAGASASDICDPAPVLTVILPFPAGTVYPLGVYSVTYRATDASGNEAKATRGVIVIDTVKPVITLVGPNPTTVEYAAPYVDAGATATDNHDKALPVSIDSSKVNTAELGTYAVSFSATDSSGNTATASRTVQVRDTIAPVITLSGASLINVEWGTPYVEPGATAIDFHDGTVLVTVTGAVDSSTPGTYVLRYNAVDASGNAATTVSRTVVVRDTTPPVITVRGASPLSIDWGVSFADPGATAHDNRDGAVAVVASGQVNPCIPGDYTISYSATDASGNTANATRVVHVLNTVTLAVSTISRDVDPATGKAAIDLAQAVSGVQSTACGDAVTYHVTIRRLTSAPGEPETYATIADLSGLTSLPTFPFPAGTSAVRIEVSLEGLGAPLLDAGFTVKVADPFNVTLPNVAWPLAHPLPAAQIPGGQRITVGSFRQMLARAGESRWFKIHGAPGSNIQITLKNLPANYDLVVYSDIRAEYERLLELLGSSNPEDQKQALLGAQSAQEAYLQEAYLQEAYLQEAYLQEAYLQEAYLQEAYLPESFFQEAYLPETYLQEAYLQEAYLQEAYLQEAYLPESFSAAQLRSLVTFSAATGTANEFVRFNTYSASGDFYIRVRGQNGLYSLEAPFEIEYQMVQDLGANVTDLDTTPATNPAVPASTTSLLLWDSSRLPGTALEKSALASSLASFAAAVGGFVVDVSTDSRINALNAQADANPAVPLAKNLVAETIRNLILRCRSTAPSIRDITLLGSDRVIPFFRVADQAQLAGESNYYPPVKDGTHSQSSLRLNQVLAQDRYGSTTQISLATGPYDLPGLPVGRLVETAAEISAYLSAYLPLFTGGGNGTLPKPRTAFVSGYEFLTDHATAMRDDFSAGLGAGSAVDTLISPADLPPALSWTADQLRAKFLGSRHDLAYLGGHFSGGGTLAADYRTRMTAREMDASGVNLQYSLVLSTGCHSGYNTVDDDSITLLTEQPDWAQAFSRKKAMWISGTGYQYGDTDFIEYTERLQLEVARALRTGNGPISIGQAVTAAKLRYLTETSVMRGIHEKTLLQLTLYGLPMVRINLAGARLAPAATTSDVATVQTASGVGSSHGLKTGELIVTPALSRIDRTLTVIGTSSTVVASYFTGSDGIVSLPGEPVRALETRQVSRPADGYVRGVGFRSGNYNDLAGFRPFVGVPVTESSGIHGRFYTEVYYPIGISGLNQAGEFGTAQTGSHLNVFPTQFLSDGPASTTGYLRKFDQLKFSVFYCPETSAAALASAPALNIISSSVNGSVVRFDIQAAAAAAVGVQEVWVTYTGLPGSPLYGTWRSLTLTPPAAATGIGHWTGNLTLGSAAEVANLRFLVQAVNGVGVVVANTNFGRFFEAGKSTLDATAPKLGALLALDASVPTSAPYRASVPVRARLTDAGGSSLGGRWVRFQIGSAIRSALTDANGIAATDLIVNTLPGNSPLQASFAGDQDYGYATTSRPFQITKMGTELIPTERTLVTSPAEVTFDLRAMDGSPVPERTVLVTLKSATVNAVVSTITDAIGRLRLPQPYLPAGTYLVSAYFAQPVLLPDGGTVGLNDPLYGPSQASATVTIASALRFDDEQAWLNYSDLSAPGATPGNRALTKAEIAGSMAALDSAFNPGSILATSKANNVTVSIRAMLSDKIIAQGSLKLKAISSDRLHWRGDTILNGVTVQVYVDWDDTGGTGKYHAWIYPASGTGPLYGDTPAILEVQLTLGTGTGERPAGGSSRIGAADKPWTQENANSRVRSTN